MENGRKKLGYIEWPKGTAGRIKDELFSNFLGHKKKARAKTEEITKGP